MVLVSKFSFAYESEIIPRGLLCEASFVDSWQTNASAFMFVSMVASRAMYDLPSATSSLTRSVPLTASFMAIIPSFSSKASINDCPMAQAP